EQEMSHEGRREGEKDERQLPARERRGLDLGRVRSRAELDLEEELREAAREEVDRDARDDLVHLPADRHESMDPGEEETRSESARNPGRPRHEANPTRSLRQG